MKKFNPPRNMTFNGETFYFVSFHDKFHDANSKAKKIQKDGFRIRIVPNLNKLIVYKKKRNAGKKNCNKK